MNILRIFVAAAFVIALGSGIAWAQVDAIWSGGGGAGDTDFLSDANWAGNDAPDQAVDTATFNLGSADPYTVTFSADVTNYKLDIPNDRVNFNLSGFKYMLTGYYGNMYLGSGATDVTVVNITNGKLRYDKGNIFMASAAGSSATVNVDGPDASFEVHADLIVGDAGQGFLNVSNGAYFREELALRVGWNGGVSPGGPGLGHVVLTGADSVIDTDMLKVYSSDNPATPSTVEVLDGGVLNITKSATSASGGSQIGRAGGDGTATVTVDGDGSQLNLTASGGWLCVGYASGTGSLIIRNGGSMNQSGSNGEISVGKKAGSNGIFDVGSIGAGTATLNGSLYFGGTSTEPGGVGTGIIGPGGTVTVGGAGGPENVGVYSGSSLSLNGGTLSINGSLTVAGALNFQFSNPKHGRVILSETGQSADITKIGDAPLGFSFLGGGNTFVPTVAGCMDFIVAETITGFLTNAADAAYDNMDELLAAANGGKGYPSYAYGIVTIDSDDYVGGAYDGYKALRLSVLPADADLGGLCDGADLLTWQNGYSAGDTTWDKGDYNLSGLVDGPDLLIWQNNYGKTLGDCSGMGATGAAAAVPEPMTLVLLGLGAVALIRRRR